MGLRVKLKLNEFVTIGKDIVVKWVEKSGTSRSSKSIEFDFTAPRDIRIERGNRPKPDPKDDDER